MEPYYEGNGKHGFNFDINFRIEEIKCLEEMKLAFVILGIFLIRALTRMHMRTVN